MKKLLNAAFSPDGKKVITSSNGTGVLWDVETGAALFELKGWLSWGGFASFAFSPDNKKIVTAEGSDGCPKIKDVQTGKLLIELNKPTFR